MSAGLVTAHQIVLKGDQGIPEHCVSEHIGNKALLTKPLNTSPPSPFKFCGNAPDLAIQALSQLARRPRGSSSSGTLPAPSWAWTCTEPDWTQISRLWCSESTAQVTHAPTARPLKMTLVMQAACSSTWTCTHKCTHHVGTVAQLRRKQLFCMYLAHHDLEQCLYWCDPLHYYHVSKVGAAAPHTHSVLTYGGPNLARGLSRH